MRRAALLLPWLCLCACSSDDAPGASIASPAAFARAANVAACEAIFRCAIPGQSAALARAILGTSMNCVAAGTATALLGWGNLDDLAAAQRDGKARFDGAAAARCIARIQATCDVQHALRELCADVFTGTVAAGGQCLRGEECAGGWCDRGQATGALVCPGACRARVRVGEACTVNAECAPRAAGERAECFPDVMGAPRCTTVRTLPPAAENAPCGHQIGASGGSDTVCADGLSCVTVGGSAAGTCRRNAADGEACGAAAGCVTGSACTSTTTGRCTAITVRRAPDTTCNLTQLVVCDGTRRLACSGGMCRTTSDGAMGSACGAAEVPASLQCNEGLYCASGRCAMRKADGAACMSAIECLTSLCGNGRCGARTCS